MVSFQSESIIGGVRQVPCRLTALFWDRAKDSLVVTVRLVRSAGEIGARVSETNAFGHRRIWEETGAGAEVETKATALLDFVEILTPEEIDSGMHTQPWIHGERVFDR